MRRRRRQWLPQEVIDLIEQGEHKLTKGQRELFRALRDSSWWEKNKHKHGRPGSLNRDKALAQIIRDRWPDA